MPGGEETPPETPPEEVPPEEPGETPPEEPPVEEPPEKEPETPKFEFVEPEVTDKPFMTVIHQGKEVAIATEEDAKNYIQKGYDYDFKVGPHGKLARTMEEHPEFKKRVAQTWEDYASGKTETVPVPATKPELKSIDEYENPNDWFWDNHEKVKAWDAANVPTPPAPPAQPAPVQQPAQMSAIDMALVGHDPQYFHVVAPKIKEFAEKELTKAQYDRIDNDLPSLIQFYDYVKGQIIKKPAETVPDPPFRVQSGGGEAPEVVKKAPWEGKNNDEFEQYMASVKGIVSY